MNSKHRRWTVFVVAVWVLALGLTTVLAPTPVDAKQETHDLGWMTYAPNHPNACAPLPFDCYFVDITVKDDNT